MSKGFSGSTIKSWFQYRCERKVRFELSSNDELAAIPVIKDVRQASWAALGTAYEGRVVQRLNREEGVRQPTRPKEPLDEASTAAFLRGKLSVPYIAQANLTPRNPPRFLEGTGLSLNRNLPDLIRRSTTDGSAQSLFTIIDVKATRRATAFHKAQVAFYVRVLVELLRELDLAAPAAVQLDLFGEVWRIPDDGTAEGDALVEGLRPDNPLAQAPYLPAPFSLSTPGGMAALNAEVTRQAAMVAYVDDFKLIMLIALASLPLLLLLRDARRRPLSAAADD